jgi:hypothetical protein
MTNNITSCQANQLLALQRELMESGLIVTVGEPVCSAPITTATKTGTTSRKTATRTKKRRGRPPKAATTTTTAVVRKMSKAGRKAIAASSGAYHARIKELREDEHLTQKQARARYQELKESGAL